MHFPPSSCSFPSSLSLSLFSHFLCFDFFTPFDWGGGTFPQHASFTYDTGTHSGEPDNEPSIRLSCRVVYLSSMVCNVDSQSLVETQKEVNNVLTYMI